MPNKQYIAGRSKEYEVRDILKGEGYPLVVRTAGSHSPVDIIAIKEMQIVPGYGLCFIGRLIQCKYGYDIKTFKIIDETIETENGSIEIERWMMPRKKRNVNNNRQKQTKTAAKKGVQPPKPKQRVGRQLSKGRKPANNRPKK